MVTADEVREACLEAGITRIPHHECGLCGVVVQYLVEDGDLFFDSSCGCTTGDHDPDPRSWQDAADMINRQPTPATRKMVREAFGIKVPVPTWLVFFANGLAACGGADGQQIGFYQGGGAQTVIKALADDGYDWRSLQVTGSPGPHNSSDDARAARERGESH